MTFREKLDKRIAATKSLLCVGLDADIRRIPATDAASDMPQFAFNKRIIDATHEHVIAYKPNMAFYEARGERGIGELVMTMEYLRATYPTIVTICDAKRADIGSTNEGYVTAVFDRMGFDAVTLNPYLGKEALLPFLSRKDRGCIILAKTSNPGSGEFQDLMVGGEPLWQTVTRRVAEEWDTDGNCGLVVGATYPEELATVRHIVGDMPILIPGVGTQGGDLAAVLAHGLTNDGTGAIINASRAVIFADDPGRAAEALSTSMRASVCQPAADGI